MKPCLLYHPLSNLMCLEFWKGLHYFSLLTGLYNAPLEVYYLFLKFLSKRLLIRLNNIFYHIINFDILHGVVLYFNDTVHTSHV